MVLTGVRRVVLSAASAALLAGPTVLAFFAGGYFEQPTLWAGLLACVLVAVAAVSVRSGVPRGRAAGLAIGGLAGLAGWTLLSTAWAPIKGDAYQAGQQVVLYTAVLIAAVLLLQARSAARAVEPVLAAGTVAVIGYGLSERLLPGVLHFARSVSAEGRLEQPLTYWNAMGELAAIGFVLCARISGDAVRTRWERSLAAAAAPALGLGLYLSFSRGALFACVAGLVTLIVAAPRREQLGAIGHAVLGAAVASLVGSRLRGVTALAGSLGTRERQGLIMLLVLVALAVVAAAVRWVLTRRERTAGLRLPAHAPWIALAVLVAGLAVAILVGNEESSRQAQSLSSGASRLVTLRSNRYAYLHVALRAFGDEPLRGVGAGGWSVYWLRDRTVFEAARDAHSLPLQTAAELGVVGLALLAAFLAGVTLAAAHALRSAPVLAAGPVAAVVVYIAHAPLDWDWQMPALTSVAVVLAGALVAIGYGSQLP
ncbi:MAG: O-antigen ligase family protein [Solirubrobacteraceae bacterium]